MTGRDRGIDAARLRVALRTQPAREAVAGRAADARAALAAVDAHRVRARVDPLFPQPRGELRDVGLVLQGRVRKRGAAPRLGRVLAGGAVDAVHPLGLAVVGLEVRVAERPRRRNAVQVLDGSEVMLAESRQTRAVDLGVAADDVVHAGGERPAGAVEPLLGRLVPARREDRVRRPVLRLARQALPPLEHEHVDTAAGEGERGRAAPHAGADDDNVRTQRLHRRTRPSRTMRSARLRVAATTSALRWSLPSAHRRASSGAVPWPTRRATSRSIRTLLGDLAVPDLVEQLAHLAPAPAVREQVVALGDDEADIGLDGDRARERLLDLAVELGSEHGLAARVAQPAQQRCVAGGIEGVDRALARVAAEAAQLRVGEMEAVHRDDPRQVAERSRHVARERGLARRGRPGDAEQPPPPITGKRSGTLLELAQVLDLPRRLLGAVHEVVRAAGTIPSALAWRDRRTILPAVSP